MTDLRRTLAANAVYSALGTYADYVAGFLISIVIARRLSPPEYGSYTLLMWLVLVGVTVANHGITTGVMKFVAECRGWRAAAPAAAVFRDLERLQVASSVVACAGLAIVLLGAPGLIAPKLALSRPLLWGLTWAVFARSLQLFYLAGIKGLERFRAAAAVSACVAPIGVLVVVAAASAAGSIEAFVAVYAATSVVSAAALRLAVARGMPAADARLPTVLRTRIVRHVRFAAAIVALDLVVLRQTEVFFLNWFSTPAAIGFFGLGRSLSASAMLLVPGAVTALLLPAMARTFSDDPALFGRRFLAATRYILILVVPVVALGELYGGDLIVALYGPDYAPAARVFRVTIAASAIGVISASASSYQLGTDRQPAIVRIMTAVAVVTLALDFLLIRALGLDGAILAGAAGSLMLGLALLWHAGASLQVRLQWQTYARVVLAGALASCPAVAFGYVLPLWLALPLGAALVLSLYAVLSVALRAWTREDLRSMLAMSGMLPRYLERPVGSFLRWAVSATPMTTEPS